MTQAAVPAFPQDIACKYNSGFHVMREGAAKNPASVPFAKTRELRIGELSLPRRGLQLTDDRAKGKLDEAELYKDRGFDSVSRALVYDKNSDPDGQTKAKENWLVSLVITESSVSFPDLRIVTLDERYGPQGMMQIISTTPQKDGTYEAMLIDPVVSSLGWSTQVLFGSCQRE